MREFKVDNAEATQGAKVAALEGVKAARVKQMNKAVKALERNGFELTVKDGESDLKS